MAFHQNINKLTKSNDLFRKEIVTTEHSQVVLMSLLPGEDIGMEIHNVDQTLVFVEGTGEAVIDDAKYEINPGDMFVVPMGSSHNFINTNAIKLKLFTVYAPPEHKPGTVEEIKDKESD